MNFPKRHNTHIIEDDSIKILKSFFPNRWIAREMKGSDYGIDVYLELVKTNNEVTGELLSIQLKGTSNPFKWNTNNELVLYNVKIETTNYWYNFPIPVFLFYINSETKDVYFLSVKKYIRENFADFLSGKLNYKFKKKNNNLTYSLDEFLTEYINEKKFHKMYHNISVFLSSLKAYDEFISEHYCRDCLMELENSDVLFMENFYNNIKVLSKIFGLEWNLRTLDEYQKEGMEMSNNYYLMLEYQASDFVEKIGTYIPNIYIKIKDYIKKEICYWEYNHTSIYNYLRNLNSYELVYRNFKLQEGDF